MTAQEEFWSGDFGNRYTARNRVQWRRRVPFWRQILAQTDAGSILEVGCNIGSNLIAMRDVDPLLALWGIDVNRQALIEAQRNGLSVANNLASEAHKLGRFDLVASVGVLIHIAPEQLPEVMTSIAQASREYVLAVEYAADKEEEIEYRGHVERLWKRPFGKLYEDMGLTMVEQGEAPADAFDRCHWWLLKV